MQTFTDLPRVEITEWPSVVATPCTRAMRETAFDAGSPILEEAYASIRKVSPRFDTDRSLKPDVDGVAELVESGTFYSPCAGILPSA